MPLFAILCHDRADAGPLRAETRPRHLSYLERIRADIAIAGPILDGDVPTGSLIVAAFAAADPYA